MKPFVIIKGGGVAGQVLQKELHLKGIASRLDEHRRFPRDKVCGGILQADSWEYLNSVFAMDLPARKIKNMTHFWGKKKVSTARLANEMVYVPRLRLDDTLHSQNRSTSFAAGQRIVEVIATGAEGSAGEWIGFQGQHEPIDELQMYHGHDIYMGITPTLEKTSHVALIVKRGLFKDPNDLDRAIHSLFGLRLKTPLKGTGRIRYGYSPLNMAIGDAKLATHPFLGLGMKHAILSARLMAGMISDNRENEYDGIHRKIFIRFQQSSRALYTLNASPLRFLGRLLLAPPVFRRAYEWLHSVSVSEFDCRKSYGFV